MDRFLVFFLSLFICSCNGQVDKKNISVNELDKKIEKYNYKHNKKIFYGMGISAFASVEVFVDDILVARKETPGNLSFGIELNDWVLNNGKHTYKVRYLPQKGKDMVLPYLLKETDITIDHWEYVEKSIERPYSKKENYTEKRIRIPVPPAPVPVWEVSGEFEVIDLPFELEGWKNSQDLSKIDSDALEKEVVAYYKYLRDLLNNGEIDLYLSEGDQKDQEIIISTYDENEEWYRGKDRINKLLKKCPNNMLPIENWKMEILGEKLVRFSSYR